MLSVFDQVVDAQEALYDLCGFEDIYLIQEKESKEYYAHYYTLGNHQVRFRISKKTPKKSGQFVTMWQRRPDSIIRPYDQSDDVDLFVINTVDEGKIGQFVFTKSILLEKNVFSKEWKGGKRAIRVYAPWDDVHNEQARRTQSWQQQCFLNITPNLSLDADLVKKLYLQ